MYNHSIMRAEQKHLDDMIFLKIKSDGKRKEKKTQMELHKSMERTRIVLLVSSHHPTQFQSMCVFVRAYVMAFGHISIEQANKLSKRMWYRDYCVKSFLKPANGNNNHFQPFQF